MRSGRKKRRRPRRICVNKKKSKIIHQIKKEDKAAYKQKIIDRNSKAREQTQKGDNDVQGDEPYDTNRVLKAAGCDGSNSVVFDDVIHAAEHPKRVEKYQNSKSNSIMSNKKGSPKKSPKKGSAKKSKYIVNNDNEAGHVIHESDNESDHKDKERGANGHKMSTPARIDPTSSTHNETAIYKKQLTDKHIADMEKASPSELSSPEHDLQPPSSGRNPPESLYKSSNISDKYSDSEISDSDSDSDPEPVRTKIKVDNVNMKERDDDGEFQV
jgi:hypothetical protein